MREVHAGKCEHPYIEELVCPNCEVEHEIVICRDCGEDVGEDE